MPNGLTPQERYAKKYIVRVTLCLNRNTDADILERIGQESNRQGFLKSLIRAQIEKERKDLEN